METIKKKMLSLKSEKEVAIDAKEAAEADLRSSKEREEQLNDTIKERDDRIKQLESELDSATDKLNETQGALDEATKAQGIVSILTGFLISVVSVVTERHTLFCTWLSHKATSSLG
nr:uncharacterized protein LOC129260716 [Lytechinus pictus]